MAKYILFDKCKTAAIEIAPNATWESPSPMNENLFKTNVTPNNDEQREIKVPTINAYLTKGNCKYSNKVVIFLQIS